MKQNPFKFGSVVEGEFFTNRIKEQEKLVQLLKGNNHIIIMSPRRFGKTSLVNKVIKDSGEKYILIDLQVTTTLNDFAEQLLKRIYRLFPFEKLKQYIKNFRIIPSISVNPLNNEIGVSFNPDMSATAVEDVLNLLEQLGKKSKNKLIVVFDEFQEIKKIDKKLDKILRSLMQYHQNVQYIFLGSQETLIKEIFESKKSPFYHFAYLFHLDKIPYKDFFLFLKSSFDKLYTKSEDLAKSILSVSNSHPFYTQQLASVCFEIIMKQTIDKKKVLKPEEIVNLACKDLIEMHDMDYERVWLTMNKTDKMLLISLAISGQTPLSSGFLRKNNLNTPSTIASAAQRLMEAGYVNKLSVGYEIDDPFFRQWIIRRRN